LTKSNPKDSSERSTNEANNMIPIKKTDPKTNLSKTISQEESYDDSSKNLANFFNGEIIDLD
jgi:DNA polymerase-3 subunit gamma/tau